MLKRKYTILYNLEFQFPQLGSLFQKDSQIVSQRFFYPFRVLYRTSDLKSDSPQILISVPKRKFKKAVDRNVIKRRTREAYRLTKPEFHAFQDSTTFN